MPKFRKKPVDAIQFTGDNAEEIVVWLHPEYHPHRAFLAEDGQLVINTSYDTIIAKSGDWIIRGAPVGVFYHLRPDVFNFNYELVVNND